MPHSCAEFDRAWGLGCASIALGLVALLLIVYSNPIQRLQLRFFRPGTAVPVSELSLDGPVYRGSGVRTAASTSLDALRRPLLGNWTCPGPPARAQQGCWEDAHVAPGTLLIATLPGGCDDREWYGWTNGSTFTIELATWGCIRLPNRHDMLPTGSYALLGVPLSRLPHGRLLVDVDSAEPPVPVTVP